MIDKDGWVHCPKCGSKTKLKVKPQTIVINHDLFCPKCKQITEISIEKLKMTRA